LGDAVDSMPKIGCSAGSSPARIASAPATTAIAASVPSAKAE
jgi:hypothetical protein